MAQVSLDSLRINLSVAIVMGKCGTPEFWDAFWKKAGEKLCAIFGRKR